jgi:1-acyl-sn-glycerol-3-phosphate acyltransferase
MMGDNPVIFAPSHRSYGDFILMSYVCFHYKIQIPAIAAGMGKQMHVGYCIDMIMLPGPMYVNCFPSGGRRPLFPSYKSATLV